MAEPFDVTLPAVGAKPWTLNPAVQEIRQRIASTEDTMLTGRLSDSSIVETVKSAPQSASDQILYGQINLVSNKKWTA